MCRQSETMFRIVVTFALLVAPVLASGIYLPSRYFTRSALVRVQDTYPSSRSRRTRRSGDTQDISQTWMVARKQGSKKSSRKEEDAEDEGTTPVERELTYNDLGPIGKTVAGCTEVVITTALDFCTGYLQGLLFGTLVGSPGFIFRPIEKGLRQPFSKELAGRFARMNTRSKKWARTFGGCSAAFGGVSIK